MIKSLNPDDPSDLVYEFAEASPAHVDSAIDAAARAFDAWRRTPAAQRAAALGAIADRIESSAEDLGALITREVGKPSAEAAGEVARSVAIHRYFAQWALASDGNTYPASAHSASLMTRRFPIGVCGLITPWNFPIAIPAWKAAPALAFGNAVVLKPAPQAGAVARQYADLARESLPDEVFQLIEGDAAAGSELVRHEGVGAISFTGSRVVGVEVAQAAIARGAQVQCEMSGNNASVVLDDADVAIAARTIAQASMGYAGQKCTATSRVICQESVADELRELLTSSVAEMQVVDPRSADCIVGPMIDETNRVLAEQGIERLNGELLIGGERLERPGFYLQPTIVDVGNVQPPDEEIFAPVSLLQVAGGDANALELANATRLALVAAVFTSNLGRAHRFATQLRAGLVRVNAPTSGVDFHVPFGGVKESTIGPREQGSAAQRFFTEERTILIDSA